MGPAVSGDSQPPTKDRYGEHDGFIALKADTGRAGPAKKSGTDSEKTPEPALPFISLQTALGSLPSVALSSAEASGA